MNRKASARALFLATALCCLAQIKLCVATLTTEEIRARRMARLGARAGGSGQIGRRAAPVQKASKEAVAGSPAAGAAISQDTKPITNAPLMPCQHKKNAPPTKKQATSREPSPPLATSTPVTQPEEKSTPAPITDDRAVCIPFDCAVCLSVCPPEDGEKLACKHVICENCIIRWFKSSARPDIDGNVVANGSQCPSCRNDAYTDDWRPRHPYVLKAYKKYCGNGGNKKTVAEITKAGVEMSDDLVAQNKRLFHEFETFGPNAAEIKEQIEKAAEFISQGMPAELAARITGIYLDITPEGTKIGIQPSLRAPKPKWTCRHCTYARNSGGQECELCGLPRDQ